MPLLSIKDLAIAITTRAGPAEVVLRGLPYSSLFTSAKYLAKTVPVGGALLPNVCSLTPPKKLN